MISKVLKSTAIAKNLVTAGKAFPISSFKFQKITPISAFTFSENKKSPITPHKPLNTKPADDSIEGEMKPLE